MPRRLPRLEFDGVHLLRTMDDAPAPRAESAGGPQVVVIGGGFIGCELAATARELGLDITLVDPGYLRVLGRTAAIVIRGDLHTANGARLRVQAAVEGFSAPGEPCPGNSSSVAAGDVARWCNPLCSGRIRVERWNNATAQADMAVDVPLSPFAAQSYGHMPYFWSEQYDTRLQFVGRSAGGDGGWSAHGRRAERSFVMTYEIRGRIVGALAVNRPQDLGSYRALIANGQP